MKNPALTYRQFSVQGASPLRLVVMLYDGAIAALQRALAALEAQNIAEKCTHIKRALAIIAQLEGSLNFESGGEVAQTLKCFYVYARGQAMKANIENSPEILCSLIEKFATVREAWHQAEQQPPETSSPPGGNEKSAGPPSRTVESGSFCVSG
jgi:flagellar secretion chaperone FliS